jgi:hypothetical protein
MSLGLFPWECAQGTYLVAGLPKYGVREYGQTSDYRPGTRQTMDLRSIAIIGGHRSVGGTTTGRVCLGGCSGFFFAFAFDFVLFCFCFFCFFFVFVSICICIPFVFFFLNLVSLPRRNTAVYPGTQVLKLKAPIPAAYRPAPASPETLPLTLPPAGAVCHHPDAVPCKSSPPSRGHDARK